MKDLKGKRVYVYKMDSGKIEPLSFAEPQERKNITGKGLVEHPISKYMLAQLADSDPTHRSCIDLKSSLVSTLGFQHFLKGEQEKKFKDFLKSPNQIPFQTFQDVLNNFVEDIETFYDGYLEFIKINGEVAVYHVNARDIWIEPKRKGNKILAGIPKKYHQISLKGETVSFEPYVGNELKEGVHYLAHFKKYSPSSSFYGVPKYLAAFGAIAENTLIRKFGIKFFENDARPGIAILVSGGTISEENEAKIKEALSKDFKGVDNSHRALLIVSEEEGAKIEIKEISKSLDGDFLKQSDKNRDEIARVHQIAPKLLGISTAGSLGSGSETIGSLKDLIEKTIKPKQKRIALFINLIIEVLLGFNPNLVFNTMDLTTAKDDAIIWNLLSKIVDKNGKPALSVDEIRELLGRDSKIKGEGMVLDTPRENPNSDGDARTGTNTESNPDDINETNFKN